MVFDHRGRLVRHHMGGAYHGGDGLEMIECVDRLLEDAPAIYLGEEPFTEIPELAARVALGKGLGATAKAIEGLLEAGAEKPPAEAARSELLRLLGIVKDYRDERMDALEDSEELQEAARVEKAFLRQTESLERARPCRACRRRGAKTIDLACSDCRSANRRAIDRAVLRLSELLEDHEGHSFLERVRAYLRELRGAEEGR